MANVLQNLISKLAEDPWRKEVGFSPDVTDAHSELFDTSLEAGPILNKWLGQYQPCLFGKLAAKFELIRYCILRDGDLSSDSGVRDQIQEARIAWLDDALQGRASAFVVAVISERLAYATPNIVVRDIAHRLCGLYLRDSDIRANTVHHERVALEKPGSDHLTWEWLAGVNYFSSQGDRRWWHDHRIPGGIAFSVNSVGHLAKAGKIAEMMKALNIEMGGDPDEFSGGTVRSLSDALIFAMKTIDSAFEAVSGKATRLLPLPLEEDAKPLPTCPVKLPPSIADKDHCTYAGWYHTDETLPDAYFRSDVERPAELQENLALDFTYLFHDDVDNPAFEAMAKGRRVRGDADEDSNDTAATKRQRMLPIEVAVKDRPLLQAALARRRPSS